jgi:hypothetical protein
MKNYPALAALALLPSCATMMNDPRPIMLTSNPSGAVVTTSDGQSGVTPIALFPLNPREEFVATFTKEGYEPTIMSSRSKIHGAAVLNLLFGIPGLAFMLVDLTSSGSRYYPNSALNASLIPEEASR